MASARDDDSAAAAAAAAAMSGADDAVEAEIRSASAAASKRASDAPPHTPTQQQQQQQHQQQQQQASASSQAAGQRGSGGARPSRIPRLSTAARGAPRATTTTATTTTTTTAAAAASVATGGGFVTTVRRGSGARAAAAAAAANSAAAAGGVGGGGSVPAMAVLMATQAAHAAQSTVVSGTSPRTLRTIDFASVYPPPAPYASTTTAEAPGARALPALTLQQVHGCSTRGGLCMVGDAAVYAAAGSVVLADTTTGAQQMLPLVGDGVAVSAIAAHPRGRLVIVGDDAKVPGVRVINVETRQIVKTLTAPLAGRIQSATFFHDGRLVAVLCGDQHGTMHVWRWADNTLLASVRSTFSANAFLAGHPHQPSFAVWCGEKLIVWSVNERSFSAESRKAMWQGLRPGERAPITAAAYGDNGYLYVATAAGGLVMFSQHAALSASTPHAEREHIVAMSAAGPFIVAVSSDKVLCVLNDSMQVIARMQHDSGAVALAAAYRPPSSAAAAAAAAAAAVSSRKAGASDERAAGETAEPLSLEGLCALACTTIGDVQFMDLAQSSRRVLSFGPGALPTALCPHPKHDIVAVASADGCVRLWGGARFELVGMFLTSSGATALAYSADGLILAVCCASGDVVLVHGVSFQPLASFALPGLATVCAFSHTSDYLAVGLDDGSVMLLHVHRSPAAQRDGGGGGGEDDDNEDVGPIELTQCFVTREPRVGPAMGIDWAAGELLFQTCDSVGHLLFFNTSGRADLSVQYMAEKPWLSWSMLVGWPVVGLLGNASYVPLRLRADAAQELMVTGDVNGRVRMYNFPCLHARHATFAERGVHNGPVVGVCFMPSGQLAVSAGAKDGLVCVWRIGWSSEFAEVVMPVVASAPLTRASTRTDLLYQQRASAGELGSGSSLERKGSMSPRSLRRQDSGVAMTPRRAQAADDHAAQQAPQQTPRRVGSVGGMSPHERLYRSGLEAQAQREQELAELQRRRSERELDDANLTFKPQLNERSRELAPHGRLHLFMGESGAELMRRRSERDVVDDRHTFQPALNARSKELAPRGRLHEYINSGSSAAAAAEAGTVPATSPRGQSSLLRPRSTLSANAQMRPLSTPGRSATTPRGGRGAPDATGAERVRTPSTGAAAAAVGERVRTPSATRERVASPVREHRSASSQPADTGDADGRRSQRSGGAGERARSAPREPTQSEEQVASASADVKPAHVSFAQASDAAAAAGPAVTLAGAEPQRFVRPGRSSTMPAGPGGALSPRAVRATTDDAFATSPRGSATALDLASPSGTRRRASNKSLGGHTSAAAAAVHGAPTRESPPDSQRGSGDASSRASPPTTASDAAVASVAGAESDAAETRATEGVGVPLSPALRQRAEQGDGVGADGASAAVASAADARPMSGESPAPVPQLPPKPIDPYSSPTAEAARKAAAERERLLAAVLVSRLSQGMRVVKFAHDSGAGAPRGMALDGTHTLLRWDRVGRAVNALRKCVALANVRYVVYGAYTTTFKKARQKKAAFAPWRCFSLVTADRTYDFECATTRNAMDCVLGLQHLLVLNGRDETRPVYARSNMLWRMMRMLVHHQARLHGLPWVVMLREAMFETAVQSRRLLRPRAVRDPAALLCTRVQAHPSTLARMGLCDDDTVRVLSVRGEQCVATVESNGTLDDDVLLLPETLAARVMLKDTDRVYMRAATLEPATVVRLAPTPGNSLTGVAVREVRWTPEMYRQAIAALGSFLGDDGATTRHALQLGQRLQLRDLDFLLTVIVVSPAPLALATEDTQVELQWPSASAPAK